MEPASIAFALVSVLLGLGVPLHAGRARGRSYSRFVAVVLAVSLPGAVFLYHRLGTLLTGAAWLLLTVVFFGALFAAGLHLFSLVNPRLRHSAFRLGVSLPGQAYLAGGLLAGIWLLVAWPLRGLMTWAGMGDAVAASLWLDFTPIAIAVGSLVTSTRFVPEIVRFELGGEGPPVVERVPVERYRRRRQPEPLERRPLRIVQITDPHLGPWQPLAKLQRHIADLVARKPDLILLTGDFLTMEGRGSPGALARALEPLQDAPGTCFSIFGNHDHEAPDEVRGALEGNGVTLLVDDEAVVETPAGRVQIVGADYVGRERDAHIRGLLARFPRREDCVRVFLLHDPLGFQYVPLGDADLTLSGHTHGGQLGLVSFGLDWTVLKRSKWPDHGLFGHGPNRLYVHRGTGFYGFPLRIGVPGEASLLEVAVN